MKNASPKSVIVDETAQKWAQLIAQVRADRKLKQRLMDTPAGVLHEHGIEVPAGMEIRVVENTDKVFYITLPAMTEPGELTEDELTKVAGGNPILVGIAIGAIGTSFGTVEAMTGKFSANVLDLAKQYGKGKQKPK